MVLEVWLNIARLDLVFLSKRPFRPRPIERRKRVSREQERKREKHPRRKGKKEGRRKEKKERKKKEE